jgi:hypothetical protein
MNGGIHGLVCPCASTLRTVVCAAGSARSASPLLRLLLRAPSCEDPSAKSLASALPSRAESQRFLSAAKVSKV